MKAFLLVLIGVVIGAALVVAPYTKAIAKYLRPTIEGDDGKASMKRLTIALFVLLFAVAFFADLFADKTVAESILSLIATMIIAGTLGTSAHTIAAAYINKGKPTSEQQPSNEEGQVTQNNEK